MYAGSFKYILFSLCIYAHMLHQYYACIRRGLFVAVCISVYAVCMYVCLCKCEQYTLGWCLMCNDELCFISLAVLSRRNVTRPFEDATSLVSYFFHFFRVCVCVHMFVYTCMYICVHEFY